MNHAMLPHAAGFRFRGAAYWAASLAAVIAATRVQGVEPRELATAVAVAGGMAAALYFYTRWLARHDGRFFAVHPRKIRISTLVGFYTPIAVALALVLWSPWVMRASWDSQLEKASLFLAIPCLLAAAAGTLQGGRDTGVVP